MRTITRTRSSSWYPGRLVSIGGASLLLGCSDGPTPPDAGRYEVSFDNAFAILVADPEMAQARIVRPANESSFDASWSPDGQWIAYHRRETGGAGGAALHVVRPDGTGDRRLGSDLYYVRSPSWSPDGQRIADTSVDITVVVVNVQTGARVAAVASGMSPSWAPDGARIAFVADSLVVSDLSGANRRAIAPDAYEPAWSPDGRWIAFQRPGTHAGSGVVLVPADGRDSTGWRRFLKEGSSLPPARPSWRRAHD